MLGTNSVLIIQDALPWGVDSIQTVLTANGIAYDQVDSSQMGVVDLAPYKMVVIPSIQGNTYVGAWNLNIAWAEHYVEQGGRLWLSTATSGGTDLLVPGGVVSTFLTDSYNLVADATHPWVQGVPSPMFGTSANHNEFAGLYLGSKVVATAQTSGNPVLVDYMFGAGRVLITGQTLEHAWEFGRDFAPILENSLVDMYESFVSADVLIIQDSEPWGPSIQEVLSLHGIPYDQVDSTRIGVIDLAPYKMVVIPSSQGNTFVTRWNTNISWAEQYVGGGGRLWHSATTQSGAIPPLTLGGAIGSFNLDSDNDIADPGHRWVQGVPNPMNSNSASHNEFTGLYPGSQVVATAHTSGDPVLVDYGFGDGRVLLTGQPLEHAWNYAKEPAPILENSLVNMYADALILQDGLPWFLDSIQQVLGMYGIAYETVDSTQFGTFDLTPYTMVLAPSVQGGAFYTAWNANIAWISQYVVDGGRLWQSTCNVTASEPLVPGGVVSSTDYDNFNDIAAPAHPWVRGVPSPMSGGDASHDSFTFLYPGSQTIATAQSSGKPVLVDYSFGDGRVLITGQTLEYAWDASWDGGPILENSINDMFFRIFADGFESGDTSAWSSTVP